MMIYALFVLACTPTLACSDWTPPMFRGPHDTALRCMASAASVLLQLPDGYTAQVICMPVKKP